MIGSGNIIYHFIVGATVLLSCSNYVLGTDGVCQYECNGCGHYTGFPASAVFTPEDNGGQLYTWQECAQLCAQRPTCKTWSLQLIDPGRCALRDFDSDLSPPGSGVHAAGKRDVDCLTLEPAKTPPKKCTVYPGKKPFH